MANDLYFDYWLTQLGRADRSEMQWYVREFSREPDMEIREFLRFEASNLGSAETQHLAEALDT